VRRGSSLTLGENMRPFAIGSSLLGIAFAAVAFLSVAAGLVSRELMLALLWFFPLVPLATIPGSAIGLYQIAVAATAIRKKIAFGAFHLVALSLACVSLWAWCYTLGHAIT
jgi:hypothetical protein